MPRGPRDFTNGEIYHITQRGIEDKKLFLDENDYFRGIFSLYEFNNSAPIVIRERRREIARIKSSRGTSPVNLEEMAKAEQKRRNLFVETLAFCLMPNHFHLLLKQLKNDGVSEFMRKTGGYATYFNQKYNRKGRLFQNHFWSTHIEDDEQLKTEFVYVHTNPVSLVEPGWKEKGIKDLNGAKKFIEKYKWSSYADYIGGKNFPSLTSRNFMLDVMGDVEGCRDFVHGWLKHKSEF